MPPGNFFQCIGSPHANDKIVVYQPHYQFAYQLQIPRYHFNNLRYAHDGATISASELIENGGIPHFDPRNQVFIQAVDLTPSNSGGA
jgi:hypothetical protein